MTTSILKKRLYDDDTQTIDVPNVESANEETKILKKRRSEKLQIISSLPFGNFLASVGNNLRSRREYDKLFRVTLPAEVSSEPENSSSPSPFDKQSAAALVLQKSYRSHQIRRRLADCAIVAEELWWRAWAILMTYDLKQRETVKGRWARAKFRAAKVGKGLLKDEKAKKLALTHWLEAIDPCHRYGHNLQFYYDVWFASESSQPFFYWLDIGDGKEVNLEDCSRMDLKHQRVLYLGPNERKCYEVIIDKGKLVYKLSGKPLNTAEGSKWIFVLSTSRNLYVGQKRKGYFQHSSFLAGGAATAAGRLIAHGGVLEAVWPYSGHYHPTEENFMEFVNFLEENQVDLTNVKRCANDDDIIPPNISDEEKSESVYGGSTMEMTSHFKYPETEDENMVENKNQAPACKPWKSVHGSSAMELTNGFKYPETEDESIADRRNQAPACKPGSSSHKWSTGAGPRISCVRDYPSKLQFQALEQVKLSPRLPGCAIPNFSYIPSPKRSPRIHLSPGIAFMGLPSPRCLDSSV